MVEEAKRAIDRKVSSADLTHWKGFEFWLFASMKLLMAVTNVRTLSWLPRLIWRWVSRANQRST